MVLRGLNDLTTKHQIPCDSFMRSTKNKLGETESRMVVADDGGEGEMGSWCLMGMQLQF